MGVVVAAFAFVDLVSLPGHSRLYASISNAGHVPVFGIIALALLYLVRQIRPGTCTRPYICYTAALVLTMGLGALSELIQYFGPRDADFGDLGRNVLGAATFLGIYASFDRRAFAERGGHLAPARRFIRNVSLVALAAVVAQPAFWGVAFMQRNRSVPVLCDFDSFWSRSLIEMQDARLRSARVEGRSPEPGAPEGSRRLLFESGPYPGFSLPDVYPDWTGYDSLIVTLFASDGAPASVGLRIDDGEHKGAPEDRYTRSLTLQPGLNRIAIALGDIRQAPAARDMNMSEIAALFIFAGPEASGGELLMREIRLR